MNALAHLIAGHLIASGDMDDQGSSSNTGIYLFIAAVVVVGALIYRNQVRKARARVNVRRVPDAGRVALDRLPDVHSLAVGIRVQPDHAGTQTLFEGAT